MPVFKSLPTTRRRLRRVQSKRRCFGVRPATSIDCSFVCDALQDAVNKQKENADKPGRKNMATFETGDQVLQPIDGICSSAVTNLGMSKLAPRYIEPFKVMKINGEAYTLDIPTSPTGAVELPSAAPQRQTTPAHGFEPAAFDSTGAPPQAPPEPAQPGSAPLRLHLRVQRTIRSDLQVPKRTIYRLEPPPPPIVDSTGDTRWFMDHTVAHEVQRLVPSFVVPALDSYRVALPGTLAWLFTGRRYVEAALDSPPGRAEQFVNTMTRSQPKATKNGSPHRKEAAGFAVITKNHK
ncbi:hypothetical protein PR003_g24307 [Phytophthora rubi]|uniref:Uncharacterized protein n=1 Tax=Phytophthora rubi TaxID=129364 RepID=A0A6A3IR37_9STRA|nr:hypothetical protein PR002_g23506 [Phytophthora rubi]KAE8984571.1 hypothetical protein PR001_g23132 [Phytophthora rubi]KAE9294226.1 hypothetical protein PR003_g24307 [Phytophthora rubi]